jgi:hypothetical protein
MAGFNLGNFLGATGSALHLPELGISEAIGGTGRNGSLENQQAYTAFGPTVDLSRSGGAADTTGASNDTGGSTLGANTTGTGTQGSANDIAFLNDQAAQLRALLARTDTGLAHGLQKNQDEYDTQLGGANQDKERQVIGQNTAKQGAYDRINQNANQGYRSLAQIIGRASGTGSSAYREALPNAVGADTSSKRREATNTAGQNLSNIDSSFESVLADLMRQKKANEESLRSGVETQRQDINGQLAQNAGALAQAQGGGFDAVKAAQTPYQTAIDNSRNSVEGFFNQFRTPYQKQELNPNLAAYSTDRATINAQGQDGVDPSNPYASLLKRKLQGV